MVKFGKTFLEMAASKFVMSLLRFMVVIISLKIPMPSLYEDIHGLKEDNQKIIVMLNQHAILLDRISKRLAVEMPPGEVVCSGERMCPDGESDASNKEMLVVRRSQEWHLKQTSSK